MTHNCLHSLIPFTEAGKTEKQIQKIREFSSPETNPLSQDPRSKAQIEAYREKERNRARLLRERRKKEIAKAEREIPKSRKNKSLPIYIDSTKEWPRKADEKGIVERKKSWIINGVEYVVDGKNVLMKPSEQEQNIATILAKEYGKHVEIVPRINLPERIQTPDYLVNGTRYDLKSPTGRGKYLLQGLVAKKQRQAHNFIIDITKCPLEIEELEKQAEALFRSPRTGFLEEIVFIKGDSIVKALKRG